MATELKKWINPRTGETRVYINNREILGYTKAWFCPSEPFFYQLQKIKDCYGKIDELQYEIDAEKVDLALAEINPDRAFWTYETALSLAN